MLTFGQVQTSSVANVAGVDANGPQFAQVVNDAVRQLMELGNWWGTVTAIKGIVCNGCITWPKKVDAVLALNVDNNWVRVSNYWYSFIPISGRLDGLTRDRSWVNSWGRNGGRESVLQISGEQPMFYPPTPQNPFAIQITADNSADYGQTVTVYGLDTNGQEVASLQNGVMQAGVSITLGNPAPITPVVFSYVSNVVKSVTVGDVRAWQAPINGSMAVLCAIWGPRQTNPMFLYSKLEARRWAGNGLGIQGYPTGVANFGYGHGPFCIDALVKLGYEPVSNPNDILSLGNIDAIKEMVQSIKCGEDTDPQGQAAHEITAVRRLNMQLRTRFPIDEIPIEMKAFGTAMPKRHGIGRLY